GWVWTCAATARAGPARRRQTLTRLAPGCDTGHPRTLGSMPSPLPPRLPAALADALRADLAAGYTRAAVEDALGPVATAALQREEPVAARRATDGLTGPATVLTRLFLLGKPVTRAALDTALPRTTTAGAAAVGLVTAAGEDGEDEVRAAVDLRPYEASDAAGEARWWLASDLGELAT